MAEETEKPAAKEGEGEPPMASVHTTSFPQIIEQLGITIAVTTYQAGKLVLLRPEPRAGGPVLNTHFRSFNKPMGFAWEKGRFALGTNAEIWEFHDIPLAGPKLDQPNLPRHDAVFFPRACHYTGDIAVHEMLWVSPKSRAANGPTLSELWFINTRFSCLATRSGVHSFAPRWRPSFITELDPHDRCHLNGMCLRDGDVRYVSALGATNKPGGWRDNKPSGGVLIDIPSGEIMTRGLSMPHSPRWHQNKLWLLESGNGGLGLVDPATGKYEEVCRLPGFTRGFDIAGPFAFIGLSQVRDSAIFSGIAVAQMPDSERCCGVWVVDLRTGKIAAFVKFTEAVQEIFAVQALTGLHWPDVMNEDKDMIDKTYELSNEVLRQVPAQLRPPGVVNK